MSGSKMDYPFTSIKLYIIGFIVLAGIFLFSWLPQAHIDLAVSSEPLIVNFEITLDTKVTGVLFNLDTIHAQIMAPGQEIDIQGYKFVDDLYDKQEGKVLVFLKQDLLTLVKHKTEALLDSSERKKQVFEFHPEKWEIKVLNKDLASGSATIVLSMSEEVIGVYDFEQLKSEINFKSASLAKDILEKTSSIKSVHIQLQPRFYNRIPIFYERISFFAHP